MSNRNKTRSADRSGSLDESDSDENIQTILQNRLDYFIEQDFNSTPYLIMTVFGDSVIPHGSEIWLGSLVELLERLQINERLIRTSIFRLSKDGWLEGTKVGRKSFYRPAIWEDINHNERVIYHPQNKWDGNWRLIIGMSMEKVSHNREDFRKALQKYGFLPIAPNVFAHPTFDYKDIEKLMIDHGVNQSYLIASAQDFEGQSLEFSQIDNVLQRNTMALLEKEYLDYFNCYEPFFRYVRQIGSLSPMDCFLLNSLMINDYRRLLHHDHYQTNQIFNDEWIGRKARSMTAKIYCAAAPLSREYFCSVAQNSQGGLPKMEKRFHQRFKHLESS
ncbi:MAG: hypothetical protein GKR95_20325 [Gammaproteobacteria bacterium]|nr:hypothetical protein [Gammaproteobacteria bacterium]NKB64356.1 hypothetical protein [Gammaproteobacteria bacterium]